MCEDLGSVPLTHLPGVMVQIESSTQEVEAERSEVNI